MKLHFEAVCTKNIESILDLKIRPEQSAYIETVAQCLSEAARDKRWRPVGIYDKYDLIGFAMYGYFFLEYFPIGRLWLDRFLIDCRYQGKGYGKAAMEGLLDRLFSEYQKKRFI